MTCLPSVNGFRLAKPLRHENGAMVLYNTSLLVFTFHIDVIYVCTHRNLKPILVLKSVQYNPCSVSFLASFNLKMH